MKKSITNINSKRIILFTLILIWAIIVFCFSNQKGTDSSGMSDKIVNIIINIITGIKQLSVENISNLTEVLGLVVRKLAHISIYIVGSILIFLFINTYDTKLKNKILFTFSFTTLYAISDEIHQLFIMGRSGQIKDVGIDTIGTILGIIIGIMILNINRKKKQTQHYVDKHTSRKYT